MMTRMKRNEMAAAGMKLSTNTMLFADIQNSKPTIKTAAPTNIVKIVIVVMLSS